MMWGNHDAIIRTKTDTLYNSSNNSRYAYIKFPGDSSRYFILADNSYSTTAILNVVIGNKEKNFDIPQGKSVLIECAVDTFFPGSDQFYRGRKIELLFESGSTKKIKTGDTLLLRTEHRNLFDTISHREISYEFVEQIYPFTPQKIEKIIFFSGNYFYADLHTIRRRISPLLHYRKYRLIRRNPKYRDPVFRYLRRKKIWENY